VAIATARCPAKRPARTVPGHAGWVLAFLGFFLLIGAWAVAAPFNGTPDEAHHVLRAAGVARGQVVAAPVPDAVRGGGAYQNVPASLVKLTRCWQHRPHVSAACAPEPGGDETIVRAGTAAGRYHPAYYAIVGAPLALWPDMTGVLLARLISAALCAALLATALTDVLRWSRFRLMAAGLIAAFTPITAHLGGAVNPNGVEIAAGAAFFAAGIPLLYDLAADRSRTLLWHVGLAGVALVSLRTAGPLWLAVSVVALLVSVPRWRLQQLLRWRALRWLLLVVGLAGVATVAWTLIFRTNFAGGLPHPRYAIAQAGFAVLKQWTNLTDELVGVTAWQDTELPAGGYRLWQFAAASLIIWGFVLAPQAGRWRLAALFAGGVVLPSAIQVAFLNDYGMIIQGRYLLPVLVGLPLLGAFLIQQRGLPEDGTRVLLRLFIVLLLPIHLLVLVVTMVRWQRGLAPIPGAGISSFNPLVGEWLPALGPLLPLVLAVAGLLIVGWLVWPGRSVVAAGGAAELDEAPLSAVQPVDSRPKALVLAGESPEPSPPS
jgi:hypothetical protein